MEALGLMALVAFLAVLGSHYATPRLLGRKLRRLEAYTVGMVVGVWLPIAAVSWAMGLGWTYLAVIAATSAAAGIGTVLAWSLDDLGGRGGWRWLRGVVDSVAGGLGGSPDDEDEREVQG